MKQIIQKRIFGLNLLLLVIIFTTSTQNIECVDIVNYNVTNEHIVQMLNKPLAVEKTVIRSKGFNLSERYANITQYAKSEYIQNVINELHPIIKTLCKKYGNLNSSVITGMIVIENINAKEERLGTLAAKYYNFLNLKEKTGSYYSADFLAFINANTKAPVMYKDDCGDEKCSFYAFKSKSAGLEAGVRFIYDRINSDHPNYKGKFNFNLNDAEKLAYAIYDAGYANKNAAYPYDKKIMRIVQGYNFN